MTKPKEHMLCPIAPFIHSRLSAVVGRSGWQVTWYVASLYSTAIRYNVSYKYNLWHTQQQINDVVQTTQAIQQQINDVVQTTQAMQQQINDVVQTTQAMQQQINDVVQTTQAMQQQINDVVHTTQAMQQQINDVVQTTQAVRHFTTRSLEINCHARKRIILHQITMLIKILCDFYKVPCTTYSMPFQIIFAWNNLWKKATSCKNKQNSRRRRCWIP